ncbi:MAG: orotate phosphoribosyltransferase [Calditrichaceae bacterium]
MVTISNDDFIAFLIREKALRFGKFTLKSGGTSPFFINLGDICSGEALQFVGQVFAQKIKNDFGFTDILFGPPYKGISLVSATAIAWQQIFKRPIYTCYNRKEAKTHGEAGMFVGKLPQKGDRIVVVDDVLTTGGTKVEAIKMIESTFDVKISGIIVTVDRRAKGIDLGLGEYPFSTIVSLPNIIGYLERQGDPNAKTINDFYEGTYEE